MFAIFGFLAAASFLSGITLDGKDDPAVQCSRSAARPGAGGPFLESTVITGERTLLPLGVNCTYDSPVDAIGPQTVVNSDWPATITWLGSAALAVLGAAVLATPQTRSLVSAVRFPHDD